MVFARRAYFMAYPGGDNNVHSLNIEKAILKNLLKIFICREEVPEDYGHTINCDPLKTRYRYSRPDKLKTLSYETLAY